MQTQGTQSSFPTERYNMPRWNLIRCSLLERKKAIKLLVANRSCAIGSPAGSAYYFLIIIVIRHETTPAARWALLLIVRTPFQ